MLFHAFSSFSRLCRVRVQVVSGGYGENVPGVSTCLNCHGGRFVFG